MSGTEMFGASASASVQVVVSTLFCLALICIGLLMLNDRQGSGIDLTVDEMPVSGSAKNFEGLARTSNFSVEELETLDRILSKAEFRNGTVILTTLNQAWAANGSMLDMFLNSFHNGEGIKSLLDHLVIVALDQAAYARCVEVHSHCFALKTEGVDFAGEEKFFMTEDYLKMMWRRIYFLGVTLRLGYNFVFTDADVMWFRNPFKHFHPDADFENASDHFYGNDMDLGNSPNGGYVHVVSNNRTIEFYKLWYEARLRFPGRHDQDVLNDIKLSPEVSQIGVKIRFLSTEIFGGFCELSKDLEQVCTMHANCCTGLQRKLNDLQLVVEDWNRFIAMTPQERQLQKVQWRAPREC